MANLIALMKKGYIKLAITLAVIVLLELGVILTTHYVMKDQDNKKIDAEIMVTNENIINFIDDKIQIIKYTLKRNAAFFRINGVYISTRNYSDYIQIDESVTKNTVETYAWILKLSNNTLNDFQNFCEQHIISNCTIKQYNEDNNTFEKVSDRPYYYPLIFFEPPFPSPQQELLIGADLMSNDITAMIIYIAQSSNSFTATFRISAIAKPSINPYSYSIILNYPSFKNIDNPNIFDINGFASAVIKLGDVFNEAIDNLNITISRNDIDLFVFDITNDGYADNKIYNISLLYKENKDKYKHIWSRDDMDNINSLEYIYNFFGRKWIFFFIYSPDYLNNKKSNLLIIIPVVLAAIFILVDIIIIVFYKFINSLKEKTIIEENKSKIATQMLGYVNHEIRNPLNVIKNLVQYTLDIMLQLYKYVIDDNQNLNNEPDSRINVEISSDSIAVEEINKKDKVIKIEKATLDTMISDLYTVTGSCTMVEHIVSDLLDIQKLDAGKLELNNKMVNIDEFIKDLLKSVSQKIDEKQTIKLEKIYNKKLVLFIDPFRLKQILLNYLTNAVKFTIKGSIVIRIDESDATIRFSIADTGRGIPDDAKNKIFQPFKQARPEDSMRYGGVGLGLHLCKMMATLMKGTVGFESEFGKGSVFWVEYPTSIVKPQLDITEV